MIKATLGDIFHRIRTRLKIKKNKILSEWIAHSYNALKYFQMKINVNQRESYPTLFDD
jgi:hypothetical protein